MDRQIRRLKKRFMAWHRMPWAYLKPTLEQYCEIELLGSGCYASVYAIDDHRVLKVLDGCDDGYERFVKKARRSPSVYLPRIYYSGNWGSKRVFIIERLEERADDDDTIAFNNAIEFLRCGMNGRWLKCVDGELLSIVNWLEKDDLLNDIHTGNLLWRGDQPVISDPCV